MPLSVKRKVPQEKSSTVIMNCVTGSHYLMRLAD